MDDADVTAQVKDGTYAFLMPETDVTVSAVFRTAQQEIQLEQIVVQEDSFSGAWQFTVRENGSYVPAITQIAVNDTLWNRVSYLSSGGQYKISGETLLFAQSSYNPAAPALKSGDVLTITATGYAPLTCKLVIDQNGNASVMENDGEGDPYRLHVKLDGSFEAAIVGQQGYDGVTGATSAGASGNKNSAVTVYGALVKGEDTPAESDWEPLGHTSSIQLEGSKCSVSIVPDTANGTSEDCDSGMQGVYTTYSSALELNGTPRDAGRYLVSIQITDTQGRTAVSNALPFLVYTGEETLAAQLKTENFRQYENGLYAWDIMEPWAICNFGSNVPGEENSVRVPEKLEVWFGSHTSGTYGYLGYDIPWEQVLADEIPQTLYVPAGCALTLCNLHILSSVRIVVKTGGRLTLSDSVVQGVVEVENGGVFSMNYDAAGQRFTTGAALCGQLRLKDGAVLENAAIYSHTNYLANGDRTDRSSDAAVVCASGHVTVRGQVFVHGDEAGSTGVGQTALQVTDGTVTLEAGAVLVAYGGGGNTTLYADGGSAVVLERGTVTGQGKLVAVGGSVTFGNGGSAVTGNGAISVEEVFLQGATAYTAKNVVAGQALHGDLLVSAQRHHLADGTVEECGTDDPLAVLRWVTGVEATPPLAQFVTLDTPVEQGGVSLTVSGAETATLEEETLHFTVSAHNTDRLATVTMTLEVPEGASVAAAEDWFLLTRRYADGRLTVVLLNQEGISGESQLLNVTLVNPGITGSVRVQVTEAVLSAYRGSDEAYVQARLDSASFTTEITHSRFDVNCDGVVDQLDLTRAQRAYGTSAGDSRWNPRADLDGNGTVEVTDLILLVNQYL